MCLCSVLELGNTGTAPTILAFVALRAASPTGLKVNRWGLSRLITKRALFVCDAAYLARGPVHFRPAKRVPLRMPPMAHGRGGVFAGRITFRLTALETLKEEAVWMFWLKTW